MTDYPLRLLATLDADTHARWWIKLPGSYGYADWQSIGGNQPTRIVPATRLTPVKADYHRHVGDPTAINEVWQTRSTTVAQVGGVIFRR